jgi:hypothetical protein
MCLWDLHLLRQLEHSIYHDSNMIHPEMIGRYQGRQELDEGITHNQMDNVNHGEIEVLHNDHPLWNERREQEFFLMLRQIIKQRLTPTGYRVLPEEWEDDGYPMFKEIKVGQRRKSFSISLEDRIWLERVRLWVQGLNLLASFIQ